MRTLLLTLAALLALSLPLAPASHGQGLDCTETSWTVASAVELADAAFCWFGAEPGEYTVTFAADITGSADFFTTGATKQLSIMGQGHTLSGKIRLEGDSDSAPNRHVTYSLENLTISSADVVPLDIALTGAAIDRVRVEDSRLGIRISDADVHVTNSTVTGTQLNSAVYVQSSRVLIEHSAIQDNLEEAANFLSGAVMIRNSIVTGNGGGILTGSSSEVVIEQSTLFDNDDAFQGVGQPAVCCRGMLSILNSTVSGHDSGVPVSAGVGSASFFAPPDFDPVDSAVRVANSTVIDNGNHDLVGPVLAQSSLIGRCEPDPDLLFETFDKDPLDAGANAGGCFATQATLHRPLADNGCVVPTVAGCTPTISTARTSPARGAGNCAATLIVDPSVDFFSVDVSALGSTEPSALTTIGPQLVDQRGFTRVACDAGSYESDANDNTVATDLAVLLWNADEPEVVDEFGDPICCEPWHASSASAVATIAADLGADVVVLQNQARVPFRNHLIEEVQEQLAQRAHHMLHDFAAAFEFESEIPGLLPYGGTVFTRLPILSRSSASFPDPGGGRPGLLHEVVLEHPSEPLRIVNVQGLGSAPCHTARAMQDWIDAQPVLTTIVAAGLDADPSDVCASEATAPWVHACATAVSDPSCIGTLASAPGTTHDYLLHRAAPGSTFELTSARVEGAMVGAPSDHRPVIATYRFDGAGQADVDGDGVPDTSDNCPTVSNAAQADRDGDGIGTECDAILDGDANCDAARDIIDALMIAQFDAAIRAAGTACPLADRATQLYTFGADANNDGTTDIIDALLIAQCSAGVANNACPGL